MNNFQGQRNTSQGPNQQQWRSQGNQGNWNNQNNQGNLSNQENWKVRTTQNCAAAEPPKGQFCPKIPALYK